MTSFSISNTLISKNTFANISESPIFNSSKIQNVEVSPTTPNDGDVLVYDSNVNQYIKQQLSLVYSPDGPTGPIGPNGPAGPTGPIGFMGQGITYKGTNNVLIGGSNGTMGVSASGNTLIIKANIDLVSSNHIFIGTDAGSNDVASASDRINIGTKTGFTLQSRQNISVGVNANYRGSRLCTIAIGKNSGMYSQRQYCISIGNEAGSFTQGKTGLRETIITTTIAIGNKAGYSNQNNYSICIGNNSGHVGQEAYSIAIGTKAGQTDQHANTIILNAQTDISLNSLLGSSLFIKPIRNDNTQTKAVCYNDTSGEVVYSTTKTFVIKHPLNKDKYLVHACLEGPEAGVYYRGKSEIPEDGVVTIMLPDYVDTLAYDFTIQITPIWNGVERILSCSVVFKGSFTVYGKPGPFSWFVYGKRENINVEPDVNININGKGPYKYFI